MANKCSNCGFEYGEFDIYCSRCGHKIDNNADINSTAQQVYENYINENEIQELKNQQNFEFFSKKKLYESNIFDAFAVMFTLTIILTVLVYLISYKQANTKAYLKYKNYISKPTQIPILKTPETIEDFAQNLYETEDFMKLYLKYSKDDNEKKEQIFAKYLNEILKTVDITNENVLSSKHPECESIKEGKVLNKCRTYYNNLLKNKGVKVYPYANILYFYPNKKFAYKNFSKFVTPNMHNFLKLESKFPYPVSENGILYKNPKYALNKISKYEKLYNSETDQQIKNILEQELYDDVTNVLFARNIYATTTHEMQPIFKKAFTKHIANNRQSALNPLFMSYMDKQKLYTEENFTKDYPYKICDDTFYDNVENSTFKDIFAQLRKNLSINSENVNFAFVYSLTDGKWHRYRTGMELNKSNYIISYPDEDNNVFFYDFAYSPIQEMNIQDNTNLFINSGQIYIYNYDKLAISKITFNGRVFNTKNLNFTDITSMFPGVNIINIDSTNGYNIYIEKANKNANFIMLSRYAQGLKDYELAAIKGEIKKMTLSNMFSVNTNEEVIVSFHSKSLSNEETSEQLPTYKIHITTIGHQKSQFEEETEVIQDEQKVETTEDEDIEKHTPTIKPKIDTNEKDALVLPPAKTLEPINDDED